MLNVYPPDEQYLMVTARVLSHVKARTYQLMRLEEGQHVLDVGCGPGIDTLALSRRVGALGRVVGVDRDAAMVAAANLNCARAGVQEYVQHYQFDAASLPFDSGSFAACRSERMLQHVDEPKAVLSEMARLTRPKGWVVVADTDWGTMSFDTNENNIERRLVQFAAEHSHPSGFAGRQLYRLFRTVGLTDITAETFVMHSTRLSHFEAAVNVKAIGRAAVAAGALTEQELGRFYADIEANERNDAVFGSVNMVLVSGRVQ